MGKKPDVPLPERDLIPQDMPLTLEEAATTLLRGLVKPATLRRAISRGELSYATLGRRIVVYADDIMEWQRACRVEARKAPGSGFNLNAEKPVPPESSARSGASSTTEDTSEALAALRVTAAKLNSISQISSANARKRSPG